MKQDPAAQDPFTTVHPETPPADESGKGERLTVKELKKALAEKTEHLAAGEAALAELNDKYLRLFAEYDNFRRRSAKEREQIFTDAVTEVIRDFLPIADSLERASLCGGEGEQVAAGLAMTLNNMTDMLSRLDVHPFGEVGEPFDPALHNAVQHEEDDSARESEIAEVYQRGYRRGDRVIRHAMVKVVN
ncbi:MAG: nucleotide exchange factor GrpE [Eubacteriales bacterium]